MPQRTIIADHYLVVQYQSLAMKDPQAFACPNVPGNFYGKEPFYQYPVKYQVRKADIVIQFTG
jgi:hypothetical protein